jgi:hypothetical protein
MLLPCSCHARTMVLPCSCHVLAMCLPCSCHVIAMFFQSVDPWRLSQAAQGPPPPPTADIELARAPARQRGLLAGRILGRQLGAHLGPLHLHPRLHHRCGPAAIRGSPEKPKLSGQARPRHAGRDPPASGSGGSPLGRHGGACRHAPAGSGHPTPRPHHRTTWRHPRHLREGWLH